LPSVVHIEVEATDLLQLEQECGGHRIQRVPPTEKKGRVHTSTVTVAVLNKQTSVQVRIPNNDLRIEWYSGHGAGGQHRNKHQNCCRLIHIPTGVVSLSQNRSRKVSYNEAYTNLSNLIQLSKTQQFDKNRSLERKQQVGSGMRGDKIRTYRFQDDRVVDHNTGKSASCEKVLKGYFDLLW